MNYKNSKILHSIFFFLLISFWVTGCAQPSLEEKRKLTMIKVIDKIKTNDSLALFKIIDTSFTFQVIGKERFYLSVKLIHKSFANNQVLNTIRPSDIKVLNQSFGNSYEILLFTTEDRSKFHKITMIFMDNEFDKVISFKSQYINNSYQLEDLPKPLPPN